MTPRTTSHSARQVLASVRQQNPQLAEKLQLATGPAEQLALFPVPATQRPKEVSLGLKDHEWDREHPIFKTKFSLLLFCKKCRAQIRLFKGGGATYGVPTRREDGLLVLVFSYRRPVCVSKESGHG